MKKTCVYIKPPSLGNSPELKLAISTNPQLSTKTINVPDLYDLLDTTPKLKKSEVLKINVAV